MTGQRLTVAFIVGMFCATVVALAAGRPGKTQPLGYVTSQGDVRVDRQLAPPGTAVFEGDVITTGGGAVANLKLTSGAQATLGEHGELMLATGNSAAPIKLTRGALAFRLTGTESAYVGAGNATVVVRGESGFPAICRVAMVGGAVRVFADRGHVEIRRKGSTRLVLPGKSYRVEAGMPQADGQPAGKVTNAIPQATVLHTAQTNQANLSVSDAVLWEDTVRTLGTGRVRIGLADGSVLNVGVRSTMRIVKHDTQSQQTEIEMQLGKLRGQVVKLSKPGASFQVKTQTAVIGVVGTLLTITATPNNTLVMCAEGKVNVKNVDPKVPGERTLGPGEQTNVPAGQPPTPPVPAGISQIANELNATNAGEVPSPDLAKFGEFKFPGPTTPPAPGVPPSVPPVTPALQIASAAGAGASGVLGGFAVSNAADAQDSAQDATDAANNAGEAAGSAADAANDAANAANNFTNGVQDYIDSLSPGGGGCACLP